MLITYVYFMQADLITCSVVEVQRLVDMYDDVDARVCISELFDDLDDVRSVMSDYCSVVYEHDTNFGDISTIETTYSKVDDSNSSSSEKIKPETLSHLNSEQRTDLLKLMDE